MTVMIPLNRKLAELFLYCCLKHEALTIPELQFVQAIYKLTELWQAYLDCLLKILLAIVLAIHFLIPV